MWIDIIAAALGVLLSMLVQHPWAATWSWCVRSSLRAQMAQWEEH